ncbi:Protein JBTS17 [Nymphon striatum]|nr:Protein JBTS17 [Nymphon striatum]
MPRLYVSNDGQNILLVFGYNKIFLWEQSCNDDVTVTGNWLFIFASPDVVLPTPQCKEADIKFTFSYDDPILGKSLIGCFIFNHGDYMLLSTVISSSRKLALKRDSYWKLMKISHRSIHPQFKPIRHRYAYISSLSHDSHMLAIAANQINPFHINLVFINPYTEAILVTSMMGCGAPASKNYYNRNFWVSSLAWSSDDSFVVVITGHGSITVVSRLGQLLEVSAYGCSMEKKFTYFLNLHPLITISPATVTASDDMLESECSITDRLCQKFSVCTHPTDPVFICSDGYTATCLQFSQSWVGCVPFLKSLLCSVYKISKNLDKASDLNLTQQDLPTILNVDTLTRTQNFPEYNVGGNFTLGSDSSSLDLTGTNIDITGGHSAGKIEFSNMDSNLSHFQNDLPIKHCLEDISHIISSKPVKVITCSDRLKFLLCLLRRMSFILKFDQFHRNLLYVFMKFTYTQVKLIFKNKKISQQCASLHILHEMIRFVDDIDVALNETYSASSPNLFPNKIFNTLVEFSLSMHRSWKLLLSKSVKFHKKLQKHMVNEELLNEALAVVCSVQQKLLKAGFRKPELLTKHTKTSINAVESFIYGNVDQAVASWSTAVEFNVNEMFKSDVEPENLECLLHSLLYTFLLQAQLGKVLEMMDCVISNDTDSSGNIEFNPASEEIPRRLKVDRQWITLSLNKEKLGEIITPDSVIELLMLTGLHAEAVWFAHNVGDWKTSIVLSTVCQSEKIQLPDYLTNPLNRFLFTHFRILPLKRFLDYMYVKAVIKDEKEILNSSSNTFLKDLLLVSSFLDFDAVRIVATSLMKKLNASMSCLTILVNKDVYLPAPPLFCPQNSSESNLSSASSEKVVRDDIFYWTKLLLILLHASNLAIPSSVSYVKSLQDLWKHHINKIDEDVFQDILTALELSQSGANSYSAVHDNQSDPTIQFIFHVFRSLCSIHWMLHCRDELSMCLRSLTAQLSDVVAGVALREYDPKPAVTRWWLSGQRQKRPNTLPYGARN